jgi:hypothetical protein
MGDTAITRYENMTMNDQVAYANMLAGAADLIPRGLFDKSTGKPSPAKIFLVLETGKMLGLAPMAALNGIDVIEGTATLSPRLMTALVRNAGHKLTIEKHGSIATGDYAVTVTGFRSDSDATAKETWDVDRAERAGLCSKTFNTDTGIFGVKSRSKSGEPLPWERYPEALCLWRAVGWVCRELFADVLMGLAYMPEEMYSVVGEDGTIDHAALDAREDDLIAEFREFKDKAQMAEFWQANHRSDSWTSRVEGEFVKHLGTLTIDTRPPKPGAPGQTGDDRVDTPEGPGEEDAVVVEDEPKAQGEMSEEEWEAAERARFDAEQAAVK